MPARASSTGRSIVPDGRIRAREPRRLRLSRTLIVGIEFPRYIVLDRTERHCSTGPTATAIHQRRISTAPNPGALRRVSRCGDSLSTPDQGKLYWSTTGAPTATDRIGTVDLDGSNLVESDRRPRQSVGTRDRLRRRPALLDRRRTERGLSRESRRQQRSRPLISGLKKPEGIRHRHAAPTSSTGRSRHPGRGPTSPTSTARSIEDVVVGLAESRKGLALDGGPAPARGAGDSRVSTLVALIVLLLLGATTAMVLPANGSAASREAALPRLRQSVRHARPGSSSSTRCCRTRGTDRCRRRRRDGSRFRRRYNR